MPRSRVGLLSWVVATAFLVASALVLIDRFNLVATPPDLPESTNLVDRMTGLAQYRQAIWPIFLWENILFAVGFVAAVAFAWALSSSANDRRGLPLFAALATAGGIIWAIASIMPIGAVEASVWQLYCDCGFKETEIVAGVRAQGVAEAVSTWLARGGSITLAVALVALVREARDLIPSALRLWTYLTALALVVWPLLGITEILGDPAGEEYVTLAVGVVLVPVWAVWLGRSFDGASPGGATS